jgi:L-iditol 2-dehydrogenase
MLGLFKTAPGEGNVEVRETPEPVPSRGQVLVEVKAAGICGTDIHIYHWDTKLPLQPPVIIGHEFCGVVAGIGEGVTGWKAGERVTAEPTFSVCGKCLHCRTGFYNLCLERRILGFWYNGAFAPYTVVPEERLHRLPENIDFHEGALTEPLACCVHGILELTGITPGELVVVSGPGTIGLFALQLAKASGGKVVVIGTAADGERLRAAGELGADHVINLNDEDPLERVLGLTGGLGADVVLECAGAPPAVEMGLNLVRKRGKYTQMGLFGRPITLDFERIAYKEIKLTGSFAQRWTAWRKALSLLAAGAVKVKPLISDVLPLRDWKKGFEKFEGKKSFKVLLVP